ncbi:MAG: MBL fold metallo-hydrolase [Gemmatimonadota bacterium]|nr:MAG: MBL fold metallo-hydrolase [Gemmatimonadota bacterium]
MPKFVVVGSASGMPVPERTHASLLLDTEKQCYLFDAGEGCSSSLLRCRINHHRIGVIFISHMHPDHCTGLPMLLQMMYLGQRTAPLEIYIPQEGTVALAEWLSNIYIFPEKLPFPTTIEPIHSGTFFLNNTALTITAFSNSHLQGYRDLVSSHYPQKTLESYSFKIEWNKKTVVYSADLFSLNDIIPYSQNIDLLFIEGTHIDIEDILSFLVEQHVRKTVVTHIPPELEGQEDHVRSLASKLGVASIRLAFDGMEVSL